MFTKDAQDVLSKSGYRFLNGHIIKNNMTYGFYYADVGEHFGVYSDETIYQVKTCSREIAAVMVVNNVEVIKY